MRDSGINNRIFCGLYSFDLLATTNHRDDLSGPLNLYGIGRQCMISMIYLKMSDSTTYQEVQACRNI